MFLFFLISISLAVSIKSQSYYISPVRLTNNCNDKEYFTNCGSACDLTCENITSIKKAQSNFEPYVILDEPCKYSCVPGCFCKKPLVRNRFGFCVKEQECKKSFNRNEFIEELNKFILNDFKLETNKNENTLRNEKKNEDQTKNKYIFVKDKNQNNFFSFENDFVENIFDDIFNEQPVKKNLNLEKQIENEADLIIKKISNGLQSKKFIIDLLRSLVFSSQYSDLKLKDDFKKNNGLINV